MTAYPTCRGCALIGKGCERRKEMRDKLKGLGVTSVRFKCDERRPMFPRGAPVWADTWDGSEDRGDQGERFFDAFPAIAIAESDGKMVVFIEPGVEGRDHGITFKPTAEGFCKVRLRRLSARGGESEVLCKHCDMPGRLPHRDGYICTIGAAA